MSYKNDDPVGMIIGVTLLIASLFWLAIIIFTDNVDRSGYFYVSSQQNGTVIKMNGPDGEKTTITAPMKADDAIRICNEYNKLLVGHAN